VREFHEDDSPDHVEPGERPVHALEPECAEPCAGAVRDAGDRAAYALEYRRRVEAEYAAYEAERPGQGDGAAGRDGIGPSTAGTEDGERRLRAAELPARARDLPDARDVLPNLDRAELDERKLSEYSLNPGHPQNHGKAEGWRALGYDVDDPQARREAASEVRGAVLGELLANGKVDQSRDTPYGTTHKVLSGVSGPNGKDATLVTCWLIDNQADTGHPKLTTVWVQPHRDKETPS
jgi:hypothetical protein